jgi:NAD(P)-dependent dehydrogenase (short-subunit alcohol dehydrogenase family)
VAGTWLVTGANRGIGLEFARQLAGHGESVVATARNPNGAAELNRLGVRVECLDVTDEGSVAALARSLEGVALNVLIHSAGIGLAGPGLEGLEKEELERNFAANSIGPVLVTRALLPNLRAGERKLLVALSSGLASLEGNAGGGWYAYRAAKAALNMFFRTMAAELKREGFTCVLLDPGWVRTRMGGAGAPTTPEESVRAMLKVLDTLSPADTGKFLNRRGKSVPW